LLTIGIMKSNSEENDSSLKPTSSGQFRVLSIKHQGPVIKEITLLNIKENAEFKRLKFRYFVNEEELQTSARLGEIDGFVCTECEVPTSYEKYDLPIQGVYYALFFNQENETFQDIDFRKALFKTFPRDNAINTMGIPVEGPISKNNYTDRSLEFDGFDLEYTDDYSHISFTLTVPDLGRHSQIADVAKDSWEGALGVDVTIDRRSPEEIKTDVIANKDFDVLLYGQEVSRDPDRYINWHSTQKDLPGLNFASFEHVRADRALEEGRNEYDPEKREIHYNEFQKVIWEQAPAIFLYHPYMHYYISSYIEGVGEKYTFRPADRFLDFNNWKKVITN